MTEPRMPTAAELMAMGSEWSSAPRRPNMPTAEELLEQGGGAGPLSIGTTPVAASEGEFDAIALNDEDDDAGGATENELGAPAPLTVVPTSTTNPARPRTVAAGYEKKTKTLTVVFRDGTLYNYYEVTPLQWGNFKRARSKGRFIYTYLDAGPRGYADLGSVSELAQSVLAGLARDAQVSMGGRQIGQSATSRRGGRGSYGSGNLGGSTRGRR